jgi:hypothetical protein
MIGLILLIACWWCGLNPWVWMFAGFLIGAQSYSK